MLRYKKILVVSDNSFLINKFHALVENHNGVLVDYACSPNTERLPGINSFLAIKHLNVKLEWRDIIGNYDLVFSLHCKQLFPNELVQKVKCINVHPGLNPHNRGWFPQVFSILNGMKAGATIHEIDEQLDHGAIIAQKEITIEKWDTSLTAYNKIQEAEIELLKENLSAIIAGDYKSNRVEGEGNLNLKKDFNSLRKIDLRKQVTMNDAIDYLRAMTHGEYKNAYFIDEKSGGKVFVSIDLKLE